MTCVALQYSGLLPRRCNSAVVPACLNAYPWLFSYLSFVKLQPVLAIFPAQHHCLATPSTEPPACFGPTPMRRAVCQIGHIVTAHVLARAGVPTVPVGAGARGGGAAQAAARTA